MDYIDLYYAHVDWYEYPLEERLKAFDLLVPQRLAPATFTPGDWKEVSK